MYFIDYRFRATLIIFLFLTGFTQITYSAESCSIIDYGLFSRDTGQINLNDKKGDKAKTQYFKVEQISETSEIPLELGNHFGFSYKIINDDPAAINNLIFRADHPQMINPETSEITTSYVFSANKPANNLSFFGFLFEEKFELVAGDWLFQIISENGVICQKGFTVSSIL
jgi:hypothetical protein